MHKYTKRVKRLDVNTANGEKVLSVNTVSIASASAYNAMLQETLLTALTSRDPTITLVTVRDNIVDAHRESFVKELVTRHGSTRKNEV